MNQEESVLLAIGVAIAAILLAALGRRLPIPTAILQVLGGLVVGLLPGAAALRMSPDLVFFVFLPPVLWAGAFFTSFRDFKANLRPISMLAIGLVVVTTALVAIVARLGAALNADNPTGLVEITRFPFAFGAHTLERDEAPTLWAALRMPALQSCLARAVPARMAEGIGRVDCEGTVFEFHTAADGRWLFSGVPQSR